MVGLEDGSIVVFQEGREVEETRLTGHKTPVSALAFAPDGRTMVSGSLDGAIRLWESNDRGRWTDSKALASPGPVNALAITPDGRHLVACGKQQPSPILAWALPEGTPESGFGEGAIYYSLAISPDGRFLAAGEYVDPPARLTVWDLTSRRLVARRESTLGEFLDLAFSADSSRLACGCNGGLVVFETKDFQRELVLRRETIYALAFGPDRRFLAFTDMRGQVILWNLPSNQMTFEQRGILNTSRPAFAPDGSALFAAGLQSLRRWSLNAPDGKREFIGHTEMVHNVQFSSDDRLLATTSADRTVRIWDVTSGKDLRIIDLQADATDSAFSPESRVIASIDTSGAVRLWEIESGRELGSDHTPNQLYCVSYSPRGDLLAACGNSGLYLWRLSRGPDGPDGSPRVSMKRSSNVPGTRCLYLRFSPDGQWIAWIDQNRSVRIWDVEAARVHPFNGPRLLHGWHNLAFFPDSRRLLFVTHDHSAQIWNVQGGRLESVVGHPGDFGGFQ
jgi:WD40 repeat protein